MSAATPTLGGLPDGGGKPRAGQPHLRPVIGGMLLVAIGTLYFWFSAGRILSTDIELIRRISVRARTAAVAGLRVAGRGPLAAPLQRMHIGFITPPSQTTSQCGSSAKCAGNTKVDS